MHKKNRISDIDALRGFALFGILQVNILAFSSVFYGTGLVFENARSGMDAVLAFLISAVFELKFYLLFSFLFGYSVTLQMRSAEKAGAAYLPRMMRRQVGLLLIGSLHAMVLFHGDILVTYAVLGLLLLLVRDWSNTAMLWLACVLLFVTSLFWFFAAYSQSGMPEQNTATILYDAQAAVTAYRGGPLSIVTQHIVDLQSFIPVLLLLQAPCAFAAFLIGFVVGRHNGLARPDHVQKYRSRMLGWGFGIGLPGSLFYACATQFAPGTSLETAGLAVSILTAPFLTMAFMASILALLNTGKVNWSRDRLASAGRMALTNYLMQSFVCAAIFHGYGFGFVDRISLTWTVCIAVGIFGLQVIISHWWMARYAYGPVEWLLRSLTIGRWPQWKAGGVVTPHPADPSDRTG
ncbi:DUF418 domain-containing protein [Rhizobium sp. CFBP 8762]|uniref:DUF418 domain-containing protein n=1 Tax=Rhizobium sp. CFBP 8762 TaxID=2775279 RepID=UPI001FD307E4|nr:DUF418 domain-containing protein [Rhizobium sp. CFBP 8762]